MIYVLFKKYVKLLEYCVSGTKVVGFINTHTDKTYGVNAMLIFISVPYANM